MAGGQPTRTLEHPNHPHQKLLMRKPLRSQAYEELRKYSDNISVHQVLGADGIPLTRPSGDPVTRVVPRNPSLEELLGTVRLHLDGWSLVDADGSPIPFTPENVRLLWDDESLDVTIVNELDAKHPDVVEGKREAKTIRFSFGQYAFGKLQDENFYSADPLAPGSAAPST